MLKNNIKIPYFYIINLGIALLFTGAFSPVALANLESAQPTDSGTSYTIGVLAFRGEEIALKRWGPTAEFLNQEIPGSTFKIVPFGLEELSQAVANKQIDFLLTNTGHYVELEVFYGVSRIATVKNDIDGDISTSFGAVIFTRADRGDINSLQDLKGKRFMGVKRTGFGGFQMAWRELKDQGINPFRDFSSLEFSGFPQDEVAYAVRDGLVDAGTFRSETLESMAREGKIHLEDFKILNPQFNSNYQVFHSTRLYPVWPFARLKHTSRELSEKVASVLLTMSADSYAAKASRVAGWTIPVDYQAVHQMMRELRVGPYAGLGEMTWKQLVKNYWQWITIISIAAKSSFLSKVSHELRTPLNAIIGYTDLILDDLKDEGNGEVQIKDVDNVRIAALHLLSIINDILDVTRLEQGNLQPNIVPFSISQLIGDTMTRAQPCAAKNGNRIEIRNQIHKQRHDHNRR